MQRESAVTQELWGRATQFTLRVRKMKKRNPVAMALRLRICQPKRVPPKRGNKSYSRKAKHKTRELHH